VAQSIIGFRASKGPFGIAPGGSVWPIAKFDKLGYLQVMVPKELLAFRMKDYMISITDALHSPLEWARAPCKPYTGTGVVWSDEQTRVSIVDGT